MLPRTSPPRPIPHTVEPGGQPQQVNTEIENQLLQLLNQAAKVAADNGVDFQAILMKFIHGTVAGSTTPPTALG